MLSRTAGETDEEEDSPVMLEEVDITGAGSLQLGEYLLALLVSCCRALSGDLVADVSVRYSGPGTWRTVVGLIPGTRSEGGHSISSTSLCDISSLFPLVRWTESSLSEFTTVVADVLPRTGLLLRLLSGLLGLVLSTSFVHQSDFSGLSRILFVFRGVTVLSAPP